MKSNEVFIFQMVEIQQFVNHEMNCDYLLLSVIDCNFANEINPCVGTIKQSADMKQFIVIDQLRLNESGTLVCKKPSGRLCSKVHFKQGDLDGVCGAYSLAMVFNILDVFEDSSRNSDEHGNRAAEWKMIRSLNNQDLYPNGFNPWDKMASQYIQENTNSIHQIMEVLLFKIILQVIHILEVKPQAPILMFVEQTTKKIPLFMGQKTL